MAVSPKGLLRLVRLAGISIVTLLIVVLVVLQVPQVATWIGRRLLSQVPLTPGYRLTIDRIEGNWITGLGGRDLRLMHGNRTLAEVDRFRVGYSLPALLASERRIRSLTIDRGVVIARRDSSGWDIADAFGGGQENDTTAGGGRLLIGRLEVEDLQVSAYLSPDSVLRMQNLTLTAENVVLGERLGLELQTLHATIIPPGKTHLPINLAASGAVSPQLIRLDTIRLQSARSSVAGRVTIPLDLDNPQLATLLEVSLRAAPLNLADVALFHPGVASEGDLRLQIDASAEGRLATGSIAAQLNNATLRLDGSTLLGSDAPVSYHMRGELDQIDPAALLRTGPKGVVNGKLELDLEGRQLKVADGSAQVRLRHSRLGGTLIPALRLRAQVNQGRARVNLQGQITEARVSAEGWIRPFDSIPSYRLAGVARRIPGAAAVVGALTDGQDTPELAADFRIEGRGVAPAEASISGRLQLAAVRQSGERLPLGTTTIHLNDGRLRARPELRLAGGRVRALVLATLGDTIRYDVRAGVIDDVNLAQLAGDSLAAPVSGEFAVQGLGITPEEAVATARLRLRELRHGERRLTDVSVRGRLRKRRAVLDLDGQLHGGTLTEAAAVRPFDGPVRFSIDSATLSRVDVSELFDRPAWSGAVTLRATGSGRWGQGVRAAQGSITLRPSQIGRVELTDGSISAELENGTMRYNASLQTASGSVAIAGDGRPLDSVPSFQVRQGRLISFDLGEWLGRSNLSTAVDARFTASATGTELDRMRGQLDLELLRSRINQAGVGPGRLDMTLTDGELQGEIRLEGPDAHLAADLSGSLGKIRRIAADGSIRLERLSRWTADSTRDGRLEGKFALEAAADSSGLLSASGTLTAGGGLGRVRVQTLHAVLEPGQGAIVFDTVMVRSNVATLDGSGSLALRDTGTPDTLRLTGQTGDVNALAAVVGIDSLTLDSAHIDLAVTGGPDRRRISGKASASRLLYGSTLVEDLKADARADIDSTGIGAIAGRAQVRGLATGRLTLEEGQIAGRYDSIITFQGTADLDEDVHVEVALRGEAEGDTTSLRLERLRLDEGGRRWSLGQPTTVELRPREIAVHEFRLQSGDRAVSLDGVLAFDDTSDLALRVDSFELGTLERAGLVPIPGELSGALRLTGPASSPLVSGHLALTLHDGEEEDLGHIRSALAWSRRGLRLSTVAAHRRRGTLTVQGTLPWGFTLQPDDTTQAFAIRRQPGDTIYLSVQADSFQIALLRPFIPPEIAQRVRGRLAADARIRGTPEDPRGEGGLQLTRLGFRVPALDVRYERGSLMGELAGDVLRIDTLLLYTDEEQQLAAQGRIRLRPLTNPTFDLEARLRDFVVSNSAQLEAQASGQVRLTGSFATPSVTGTLRIDRAEYVATGTTGLAVEEVQLTPEDLREVARHFGPAVLARAGDQGGFLDRFRLDLDLRFPSQVWFQRPEPPELNIEVAGRIRLRQDPGGDMRFFGTVEPVPGRSTIDVYGRTFQLTGGDIVLNGPPGQARIDVTAEYQVPTQSAADNEGVVVNVAATGNPDSISLELSSEPEMPEDDIISYVVTGRPSSDSPLLSGSGQGTDGGDLALGQLTGAVSSVVGQELGFDVFQIRQDGTSGLTLTAGRYLTPQFYVSLQQPLEISGRTPQEPGTNLGPGFELQYRVQPWLRILLQGGSLPSGVLLRGRYAY
ncbi:MAG TPA: translocation/assembly module TamB domain-containing protein [Gemmatimonadales bacterium]|nr:translocation/assembly module TamB domain-containing protein [Gemmatimonadales bacterium]